ncbi:MAG: IS66 family transposase [Desulfobacterales bacterium]|nr:IS66 family transposase [Desulfobacterales bacterium]
MAMKDLSKEELLSENGELRHENAQLKSQNNELIRLIQGVKSERFISSDPPNVDTLFPDSESESVVQEKASKKSSKSSQHKRQQIPAHIPRQERILEPEVDTSEMTRIGEVVTEQYGIDIKLYVDRMIRPKYVDADSTIHIAPYDCLFAKSNIGESLASHVVVSKYIDHLPLYRQSKMYARENVILPRSTLLDSVKRVAHKLKPVYEVAAKKVLTADYLMADESSIPVLTKDNPGAARKGQMLVKVNPESGLVVFDYIKTKEKINILEGLRGFKGCLQTDGNVSYDTKGAEKEVTHLNCLVHARRKFDAAKDFDEQRASHVLKIIQEIYMLERQMKQDHLDHTKIHTTRQHKTKPLLDQLHKYLLEQHRPDLTSNPFNRAVKYTLKRWNKLTQFIKDGRWHPDTNLLEGQIRPLALGRKNYLFAASHQGAEMAALFYSMFATCQLNNIKPRAWLSDVLHRINEHKVTQLSELLPLSNYQFFNPIEQE